MKINVSEIRLNPGTAVNFDLEEELSPVELPGEILAFRGPVKARLVVINTGRVLHVQGELEAEIELKCSRCLEPFFYREIIPFDERYGHDAGAQEAEGEEDVKIFEGDWLDVTPEVVETLILGLPMKPVCRIDCKGFCPQCGQDLKVTQCHCQDEKIDPRLEVLKNFFNRQ